MTENSTLADAPAPGQSASDGAPPEPRPLVDRPQPTARLMWRVAFTLTGALLAARAPVLRAYVGDLLAVHPAALDGLDDPHLRRLAVNVGLGLALATSLALVFLYQSLARALERHLFTPSIGRPRFRVGLFFVISVAATVPFHAICVALSRVTLRTSPWYYVAILALAAGAPFLFRRHWRHVGGARIALLFAAATIFGLLATLI
jgi:hypothetical protein